MGKSFCFSEPGILHLVLLNFYGSTHASPRYRSPVFNAFTAWSTALAVRAM